MTESSLAATNELRQVFKQDEMFYSPKAQRHRVSFERQILRRASGSNHRPPGVFPGFYIADRAREKAGATFSHGIVRGETIYKPWTSGCPTGCLRTPSVMNAMRCMAAALCQRGKKRYTMPSERGAIARAKVRLLQIHHPVSHTTEEK